MVYDNPAGLLAMSVVFEVLAIGMVLLRFISRHKMRAGFRADDWLICIALLLGTGLTVIEIYSVEVEIYGYPLYEGSMADQERDPESLTLEFAFFLLNVSAVTFIKLSVVFLYRRLFTTKGLFGFITLAWIVIIIVWGITFLMWLVFQCGSHVSAFYTSYWDYVDYCQKSSPAGFVWVYTDSVADLITVIMPLPMVIKLYVSRGRKIIIATVFAIGLFTVAASATRIAMYTLAETSTYIDPYQLLTGLSVWNYLEVMVGICAACAITIGPVFKEFSLSRHSSRLFTTQKRDSSRLPSKRSTIRDSDATLVDHVIPRSDQNHEKASSVEARSLDSDPKRPDEDIQKVNHQARMTV